jgi:uncharacterized protein
VIFFGGNIATAAKTGLRRARELSGLNVNLVLFNYRGYGGSDLGKMSSALFLTDGLIIFDYVAALPNIDAARIVVHGHSMGSLIAAHVAANRVAAAVVLESSATSTQVYVDRQVPWYAKPFVKVNVAPSLRDKGNLGIIGKIDEPLLLMVGARDRDTPPAFSKQLYEASSLPDELRRLAIIPDAGHGDIFEKNESIDVYRRFLAELER